MSALPRLTPDPDLVYAVRCYGRRSTSLHTLYSGYLSFLDQTVPVGNIQYVETKHAWVGANEPLTPISETPLAFQTFALAAKRKSKRAHLFPVSQSVAHEMKNVGIFAYQIGAEPVFDLATYFSTREPLEFLPIARSLKRRGSVVEEISAENMSEDLKSNLARLSQQWQESRLSPPLHFLSASEPFALSQHKRYFILRVRGEIQAFLAVTPVYATNGAYLGDLLRSPTARSGAAELLTIECMRLLRSSGVAQASLGMACLAELQGASWQSRLGRLFFRYWKLGYSFRSLYEFKNKLHPTRWEPLYLVSSHPFGTHTFKDILNVHFPHGVVHAFASALLSYFRHSIHGVLSLRASSKPLVRVGSQVRWPSITFGALALYATLHALRTTGVLAPSLFASAAYIPALVTWKGLFLGPFFHNHLFHLVGDLLCFFVFCGLMEFVFVSKVFWSVVLVGLFLSNPITHALLAPLLPFLSSETATRFLSERDVGSSNAVYAAVGAWGGLLEQRYWLLSMFSIYAVYLIIVKQSLLSFHHLVAIGCGFLVAKILSRRFPPA